MDWNAGKLCSADAFLYFSADYDRLLRTVICVMATFFSLFTCILLVSDWRLSMEKWSGTNLTILVFIYPTCFQEFGKQVSLVQGVPASIGQGY